MKEELSPKNPTDPENELAVNPDFRKMISQWEQETPQMLDEIYKIEREIVGKFVLTEEGELIRIDPKVLEKNKGYCPST
jgi:hypothetical protein